jgi:hypothetical protein
VVVGVEHAPAPSHVAADVAMPIEQLAAAHATELPGNAHAVAFVPSHCPLQVPAPVHAIREPCGAPVVTVLQVPMLPARSHASHWPAHAPLQQTPSTQWPLVQASAPLQL